MNTKPSGKHQRTWLVTGQHWSKQQDITWINVEPDPCYHRPSLCHNELTLHFERFYSCTLHSCSDGMCHTQNITYQMLPYLVTYLTRNSYIDTYCMNRMHWFFTHSRYFEDYSIIPVVSNILYLKQHNIDILPLKETLMYVYLPNNCMFYNTMTRRKAHTVV